MSNRSYDIDVCIESDKARVGFMLYCYEDDDCIWEQFFVNSEKARKIGEKFLDGCYYDGFIYYQEEDFVT